MLTRFIDWDPDLSEIPTFRDALFSRPQLFYDFRDVGLPFGFEHISEKEASQFTSEGYGWLMLKVLCLHIVWAWRTKP